LVYLLINTEESFQKGQFHCYEIFPKVLARPSCRNRL